VRRQPSFLSPINVGRQERQTGERNENTNSIYGAWSPPHTTSWTSTCRVMLLTAIYQHLLSDRKFGLTHNLLATKVMPTLIPLTVAPGLNIDQASRRCLILMRCHIYTVYQKHPTFTTCCYFYIHSSIATIFGTNVA